MPIYEYRCAACGMQKEYLQKMSDAPLTDCPECGQASLKKMVTAAGFHLKGSGWYATDFKNGAKPKAKSEDKSAASDTVKADDKAKPEAAKKSDPAAATTSSGASTTAPGS